MTKEEAQQILDDVSCSCDGLGVMPDRRGIAVPCTRCSGKFRSNDELKEARRVLIEPS